MMNELHTHKALQTSNSKNPRHLSWPLSWAIRSEDILSVCLTNTIRVLASQKCCSKDELVFIGSLLLSPSAFDITAHYYGIGCNGIYTTGHLRIRSHIIHCKHLVNVAVLYQIIIVFPPYKTDGKFTDNNNAGI